MLIDCACYNEACLADFVRIDFAGIDLMGIDLVRIDLVGAPRREIPDMPIYVKTQTQVSSLLMFLSHIFVILGQFHTHQAQECGKISI